jgi:hypothetical protein
MWIYTSTLTRLHGVVLNKLSTGTTVPLQDFLSPFLFLALRNCELDVGTERSAYLRAEASLHTIHDFLSLSYHQLFHVYIVTTVY